MPREKGKIWGELPEQSSKEQEKKTEKKWSAVFILLILALALGIWLNSNSNDNAPTKTAGLVSIDNGDLKINWNRYTTVDIELTESVNITNSGVYHITGSLDDGSINIDSGVKGEVKLILDNVAIKNSTGPAISCVSGDDLVIELVGENTLEDGESYAGDMDEDINSVIYSKADLAFTGNGSLNITANYQDAIAGKDDVKFDGGIYKIDAKDDGIRGKDSVYIVDGDFIITAKEDAIKSTNDTDSGKGFVYIEGGDINISAGDDAIHGIRTLIIQDGNINITKSYEGLEAKKIVINGGNVSILALDDGINAGGSSDNVTTNKKQVVFDSDEDCELIINGGEVYVNASGDGIDSNGWVYFNGGYVVVDGPTNNGNGALDSGLGIIMNGGTVISLGSSGMAETLGSTSSVFNVSIYFTTFQKVGTKIEIKDSLGNTIISHKSAKAFNHASIGTEDFVLGETYKIYLNGEKYQDFTIEDVVTTIGNSGQNSNMLPAGK